MLVLAEFSPSRRSAGEPWVKCYQELRTSRDKIPKQGKIVMVGDWLVAPSGCGTVAMDTDQGRRHGIPPTGYLCHAATAAPTQPASAPVAARRIGNPRPDSDQMWRRVEVSRLSQ